MIHGPRVLVGLVQAFVSLCQTETSGERLISMVICRSGASMAFLLGFVGLIPNHLAERSSAYRDGLFNVALERILKETELV
jgi:hypothetical protein